MNFLRIFFYKIWKVWFYIIFVTATIVLAIPLALSIITPKFFTFFSWMAKIWSGFILFPMGLWYRIYGPKIDTGQQYIVVSNHGSMLDIMLTYLVSPLHLMFIGKAELAKIPVFKWFYAPTNILVERKSAESRRNVVIETKKRLGQCRNISIYPEGTSKKKTRLIPFKDGAFTLAIDCQVPILVQTFIDNRTRFPAQGIGTHPGILRAVRHEPISTQGMTAADKTALKERVYAMIEADLDRFGIKN